MSKSALLACVLAVSASLPAAHAGDLVRVSATRTPMGTYMSIIVYAPSEAAGQRAISAAFDRVEEVEAATSTYREDSDILKVNHAAGGPPLAVSPDLWRVLRRSTELAAETGGAFDPTVGPMVILWKRTWRRRKPPTDAQVAEVRALVNYKQLVCAPDAPRVQLRKQGMRLNLSGIAKGYAVDQALAVLREQGIRAALVDAGGDMCALGSPPGRDTWLVGVRDPSRPGRILPDPLRLVDAAVATSGDYEQFALIDGRRYSHILDPRTGRPVEGMASVSVVAPDATMADAYATAASVMGVEEALAFAEKRRDIEMLILQLQNGELRSRRSSGFAKLEVRSSDTR